ncbi:MAG: hypothetical protein WA635_01080 [Gallionella sp.]
MVPVANVASVLMLACHSESHWLREILLNPLIIATAGGGIAISLSGLELPSLIGSLMGLLSQASVPMGLIAVGAGLRAIGFHHYQGKLWYGVIANAK